MVPRTALPFALLLLVVTAGCLGGPSPGTDTETATQTPTPTTAAPPATPATETPETTSSAETTFYSTDCPPLLDVEPTTEQKARQADRLVAFENMSSDRQRAFERALNGSTTLESDDVDPWVGTVVEYRGQYYATSVAVC